MKKVLYIIPGWQETCQRKPYQTLVMMAKKKKYEVVLKNVDWKQPLSPQIFPVSRNDVVFGFSLGAILAWLVAQKYPCRYLILASMTPFSYFKEPKNKKVLAKVTGLHFINDVAGKLKSKNRAQKQTTIYGEREGDPADIVVPKTGHRLTVPYLKAIEQLL